MDKNMDALISVIIPVYNAEKYVEATVESVLSQNHDNFEVILVDDGSTDNSAVICDSLSAKYDRIRVIHKANGGVSSARNAGIEAASGKYITFIDADDKAGENMLSDLIEEAERHNADKVFCGIEEILDTGERMARIADLPPRKLMGRPEIISLMLRAGCSGDSFMNSVCGGLFKAELIRRYNMRFADRPMGEDWMFNMQYCEIAASAVYIDRPYYKYLRNSASAVSRYHPGQFELWLENRAFRRHFVEKYGFTTDSKAIDARWITKVLFYAMQTINNDNAYKEKLRAILGNSEFSAALRNAAFVSPRYMAPVVWLMNKNLYGASLMLLRLYALRKR
jgi:glycosyltransferases involved in cell wall biogenesis